MCSDQNRNDKENKNVVQGDNIGGVVGREGQVEANKIIGGDEIIYGTQTHITPFTQIYQRIKQIPDDADLDKEEIAEAVELIHNEATKEPEVNPTFLERRLRNLDRMAPDILDVVLETLINPINGFREIVRKIAKKFKSKTNETNDN